MATLTSMRRPPPLFHGQRAISGSASPRSPLSPSTFAELTATLPTQLNSPPTPESISEPSFPPPVQSLIDELRAAVNAALAANGGQPRFTSSYQSILPTVHWRDTYAQYRALTSIPVMPDPRQHPDFNLAAYSPSTQPSTWSDALLHRFLSARKMSVPAACDMLLNYLAWRESYGVDDLLRQWPMPFDDVISSIIPMSFHGTDSRGRPLYFQRTGRIDAADFVKRVPPAMLVLTHIHFMERCQLELQAASEKSGERQSVMVHVIDTAGFNMGHARFINVFRYTATADQCFYPNTLGAMYLVNAPSIFSYVWNTAKRFLDVRTLEKVHIVSHQQLTAVMLELGPDNIPVEYGGTCQCEGGCVPHLAHARCDEEEVRRYEEEDDSAKEETIAVGAGRSAELTLSIAIPPSHEARLWWRVSIDRKDVILSLTSSSPDGSKPLVQPRKLGAGEDGASVRGLYVLNAEDGVERVQMLLDNTYSRFTSKEVRVVWGVKLSEMRLDEEMNGLTVNEAQEGTTVDCASSRRVHETERSCWR